MRSLATILVACLVVSSTGCRTFAGGEFSAADTSNSGNSSAGSGDSSKSSNNSSENSNDSSKSSNDSSNGSKNSSQSKNESGQSSSEQSSRNSSQNTAVVLFSATTVGGTVVGLGFLIWGLSIRKRSGGSSAAAAQAFLRVHSLQLEEDLALGNGPVLADLAQAAEIRREHFGDFARLMHAHRHELLELATPETLTPERATAFLERVGTIAREHPALAADFDAFAAAHGNEG